MKQRRNVEATRRRRREKKVKPAVGNRVSELWNRRNVHSVREYYKSRVGAEQHTHFMSRADGQSLTNLLESLFNKKNPKYKNNNERKRERKKKDAQTHSIISVLLTYHILP